MVDETRDDRPADAAGQLEPGHGIRIKPNLDRLVEVVGATPDVMEQLQVLSAEVAELRRRAEGAGASKAGWRKHFLMALLVAILIEAGTAVYYDVTSDASGTDDLGTSAPLDAPSPVRDEFLRPPDLGRNERLP